MCLISLSRTLNGRIHFLSFTRRLKLQAEKHLRLLEAQRETLLREICRIRQSFYVFARIMGGNVEYEWVSEEARKAYEMGMESLKEMDLMIAEHRRPKNLDPGSSPG